MNIDGPSMNFVIEDVGAQTWAKPSGFSSAAERDQLRGDRGPGTGPPAAPRADRDAAARRPRPHRQTPPDGGGARRARCPAPPCAHAQRGAARSHASAAPTQGVSVTHARTSAAEAPPRWRHPAPGAGGAAAGPGGCGPGRRGAAAGGGIWRRGCPPWLPGSPSRPRPGPTACSARG